MWHIGRARGCGKFVVVTRQLEKVKRFGEISLGLGLAQILFWKL